jgi:triacylglycerol esterase/lipase EstA (alpha/beta hydrolase family)
MLQLILLSALFIEAMLYVCLVGVLAARGVSGVAIFGIIFLIAILWRVSHALASYVVTSALRWRDKRTLPWGNSLAALANEFAARAVCFNWSQPFPQLALGPDPAGAKLGVPILLVHGYVCNRGLWATFRKRLAAAGLGPIYTVTLAPLFGGIDVLADKLDARIEAICTETGSEKIMIVAHSMGGLVARAYLARTCTTRITKLVTLGTGHQGSELARLGAGLNAHQMRDQSEWLGELQKMEAANTVHPATLSIYTLNDDLVYPPESSVLEWATNVPVSSVGHIGLLFSVTVSMRVIEYLR